MQRILDGMTALPAIVLNRRLDLLSANRLGHTLYSPVYADPSRPVNLARFAFLNPQATALYPNWDDAANTTVAIAHGFLTLSLIPSMSKDNYQITGTMTINYGLNKLRFLGAVTISPSSCAG